MSWYWKAIYDDGSVFEQQDTPSLIDRERVRQVLLFFDDKLKANVIIESKEQRLILVKRTRLSVSESGEVLGSYSFILIGWHSTIEGKNVKAILELHPNGEIIMRNTDGRGTL